MNRLKYLLFYRWRRRDALTGLCMRKQFFKDLNSALHRSSCVAVILADVDEFRDVNIAHGPVFGDTVLCQVAKALAARCAVTGTLGPYRDGGESFSFVRTREVENSRAVAELLRADVERLRFDSRPEVKVTIRLAVAVAPDDGKIPDELLANAYRVVYSYPREQRRNRVL